MSSSIPTFDLLSPYDIPAWGTIAEAINGEFLKRTTVFTENRISHFSNIEAADQITPVLRDFPLLSRQATGQQATEDESSHDEYFRIRRIQGNESFAFVRSILQAEWLLFRDSCESRFITPGERLDCIAQALADLRARALGSEPKDVEPINWRTQEDHCNSMQRWIRGHQIFAVLTQGLIFAFREIKLALAREDEKTVTACVDLVVSLLNGSGAALEFTGDFPEGDYCSVIRPTMEPPNVPSTFSGLLAVDHRCFVQILREMKPELDRIREQNISQHQRLSAAVSEVYDRHKHVCERFVGGRPSLMMAATSHKSGGEQIERFKAVRMKSFEPKPAAGPQCPFKQQSGSPTPPVY